MKLTVPLSIWAQKQLLRPKSCRPTLSNLQEMASNLQEMASNLQEMASKGNGADVLADTVEMNGMYPMTDLVPHNQILSLAVFTYNLEIAARKGSK